MGCVRFQGAWPSWSFFVNSGGYFASRGATMVGAVRENFWKYETLDHRKWNFQSRFNFYDFGFPTPFALPDITICSTIMFEQNINSHWNLNLLAS